jgi:hypothetical protein
MIIWDEWRREFSRRSRSSHSTQQNREPLEVSWDKLEITLEMAGAFKNRQARGSLSYMAQVWLRLADNYQDAEEVLPGVKQQQQIQPKDDDKE